tara:strand:- start:174 stop:1349 length:1176 start_codon:yes stop_codon:yes gene_type:complete
MEENENKEVVEETTDQVEETTENQEQEQEQESAVSVNEDGDIKLDMSKFNELQNADTEQETTEVSTDEQSETVQEVVEEVPSEQTPVSDEESGVDETVEEEQVEQEAEYVDLELPENVEKLVEFMNETGGTLEDYVKLNSNIEEMDDSEVLHDYYKRTKPHLNNEEINFLLEDQFSYNEDEADEKEIKRKKLALKEQVAEARKHLDDQKSKYFEEIKGGKAELSKEQQKAIDFFNRYNEEESENMAIVKNQQETFLNKTKQVFNNDFKGFEFKVGDKKMVYNINNVSDTHEQQKDINNLIKRFVDKDSLMSDAAGYHKSLFTAMNPDAIANHFYEQGKSDAIKQSVAEDKNINTSRGSHRVYEAEGGVKIKVLNDEQSNWGDRLRIKGKNN